MILNTGMKSKPAQVISEKVKKTLSESEEDEDDKWLRQVYYHDYLDEQETQNDPEKKKKFDDLMAKLKKMNGVK